MAIKLSSKEAKEIAKKSIYRADTYGIPVKKKKKK